MRRGQTESLSLVTSLIISLLIIISISFISCTIAKQQADVRDKVNFNRMYDYLQQCHQLTQKNCYCDPPVLFEDSSVPYSLLLTTHADGVYLELKKDNQLLQSKKVNDKTFCLYSYSPENKQWSAQPQSTYNVLSASPGGSQHFIAYLPSDGSLCFLQGYSSDLYLKPTYYSIEPVVTSSLRSCSAPSPSLTVYLQQRYSLTTADLPKTDLVASRFMDLLQKNFALSNTVFLSRVGYGGLFGNELNDGTQSVFRDVATKLANDFTSSFILLSPQFTLSSGSSSDLITLTYLKDSQPSAALADALQQRLLQLSGKSYLEDGSLLPEPDATQPHFSFQIRLQPLSQTDAYFTTTFLSQPWLKDTYSPFLSQQLQVPLVFIDFVDSTNQYPLVINLQQGANYYRQITPLSQALYLGTQDYLAKHPSLLNPKPLA